MFFSRIFSFVFRSHRKNALRVSMKKGHKYYGKYGLSVDIRYFVCIIYRKFSFALEKFEKCRELPQENFHKTIFFRPCTMNISSKLKNFLIYENQLIEQHKTNNQYNDP